MLAKQPCVDDPKLVLRRFWLTIEGEAKVSVPIADFAIASVSLFCYYFAS